MLFWKVPIVDYDSEKEGVIKKQMKIVNHTKESYENYCKKLVNINYYSEHIIKQIDNPKLVAFSCFVWNWNWNMQMAQMIKKKWPECIILIGGWQPPMADRSSGFFKKHPTKLDSSSGLIFLSLTLTFFDFAISITVLRVIPSKNESGIGV